jgi:hypothetical protein
MALRYRVAALTGERLQASAADQMPQQVMRLMFSAAHTCDTILREKAGTSAVASSPALRRPASERPRRCRQSCCPGPAPSAAGLPALQVDQEQQLKEVLGRTIAELEAQLGAQQQQVQRLHEQLAQRQAAAAAAAQVRRALQASLPDLLLLPPPGTVAASGQAAEPQGPGLAGAAPAYGPDSSAAARPPASLPACRQRCPSSS